MLSVIGPGGTPGCIGASTIADEPGAGAGAGGGLGSAQAATKAPTAITLSQVRVTSASVPINRRCISIEYLNHGETAKSRDVSFDAAFPRVDLHRE